METTSHHMILLFPDFAKPNYGWLKRFVFYFEKNERYIFACDSYKNLGDGFIEFEAVLKSASERIHVLLPLHSIAGMIDGDLHKNQLGFLGQSNNHE